MPVPPLSPLTQPRPTQNRPWSRHPRRPPSARLRLRGCTSRWFSRASSLQRSRRGAFPSCFCHPRCVSSDSLWKEAGAAGAARLTAPALCACAPGERQARATSVFLVAGAACVLVGCCTHRHVFWLNLPFLHSREQCRFHCHASSLRLLQSH